MSLTHEQIVQQITEVLEYLEPYFLMHGGKITFERYDSGKVYVRLAGTCDGCPSSDYTLKLLIEQELKKEVPQVTEVVDVSSETCDI